MESNQEVITLVQQQKMTLTPNQAAETGTDRASAKQPIASDPSHTDFSDPEGGGENVDPPPIPRTHVNRKS
jgi:hypothetical protein